MGIEPRCHLQVLGRIRGCPIGTGDVSSCNPGHIHAFTFVLNIVILFFSDVFTVLQLGYIKDQ